MTWRAKYNDTAEGPIWNSTLMLTMVKTKLVGLMPLGSFSTGRSLSDLAPVI